MSIAILGGLDRLKRKYEQKGLDFGCEVRVFSQQVPSLAKRLIGVHGIVIFTNLVAHRMVIEAMEIARKNNIPILRTHSGSVSALSRCLEGFKPLCP